MGLARQALKLRCMGGRTAADRFRDLLIWMRQQQLLGISDARAQGCFDWGDPEVKEVMSPGTPRTWIGSLTVTERGDTYVRTDSVTGPPRLGGLPVRA